MSTLSNDTDEVWAALRREALLDADEEPLLRSFYEAAVLNHPSMERSLAALLVVKLNLWAFNMLDIFVDVFVENPVAIRADLKAATDRDLTGSKMIHCFLYSKVFLALQTHRVTHQLWKDGRKILALFLQGRVSEVFNVDIHPTATVGPARADQTSWSDYVI